MTMNITLFRYVARRNLVGTCRWFNKIFPFSRGYQVLVDYVISTIRENKMFPCNLSRITPNPISTRGVNCPKRTELSRGIPASYATMQIKNVALGTIHCLLCGNKMTTRCNRWLLLQILLLTQHVSGWGLCVRFAGCSQQTGHITLSSTPYRQLENHSTKYHKQQPPV